MSDTFRKQYRELNEAEKAQLESLKIKAEDIESTFNAVVENRQDVGREIALARTKLEESIMWAVKAITK